MRVSHEQAEANRAHIVATAARLFRERGFDGVGVAELMAAAGFTHGGFYKHFRSKADLMAEASALGLSQTAAQAECMEPSEFVRDYVSQKHRDGRSDGSTLAALSGDAARQSGDVRAGFATGIESILTALRARSDMPENADRAAMIGVLAHSVGAIMLSRACPDGSPLADEILEVCRQEILGSLARGTREPPGARNQEG